MANIFSGLVRTFQDAHLAREMAEDQLAEIETLLAQWFLDSNEGAREFLREIARHQRERETALKVTEESMAAPAAVQDLSIKAAGAV